MDLDFHMSTKFPRLGWDSVRAQEFNESIHQRFSDIRQGGIDE